MIYSRTCYMWQVHVVSCERCPVDCVYEALFSSVAHSLIELQSNVEKGLCQCFPQGHIRQI